MSCVATWNARYLESSSVFRVDVPKYDGKTFHNFTRGSSCFTNLYMLDPPWTPSALVFRVKRSSCWV